MYTIRSLLPGAASSTHFTRVPYGALAPDRGVVQASSHLDHRYHGDGIYFEISACASEHVAANTAREVPGSMDGVPRQTASSVEANTRSAKK